MRFTLFTRGRAASLALATATVLVTAGCGGDEPAGRLTKGPGGIGGWLSPSSATSTITGPDTTESRKPGDDNDSGDESDRDSTTEDSATVRTDPRDNGAAIDPCTVLSVDDMPDGARPQDKNFEDVAPESDSVFQAACSLIYSVDALDPSKKWDDGQIMAVFVATGQEPNMTADVTQHSNADAANWGGRPGTRKVVTADGITSCDGFVPVGNTGGVASISVINTLVPDIEPCRLLDELMNKLVQRVP